MSAPNSTNYYIEPLCVPSDANTYRWRPALHNNAHLYFQVAVSEDLSYLPMEHRGGPGPDLSHEGGPVALAQRSGPFRGQRQTNVSNQGNMIIWGFSYLNSENWKSAARS